MKARFSAKLFIKKDCHTLTFKSQQYAGCLSYETSLVALAPAGLLWHGRGASELVIGRSKVRLLIGALGFSFSEYACVTY